MQDRSINNNKNKQIIKQERRKRAQKLEFQRIKHNVRKRVSGKPSRPRNDITFPGLIGKFFAKIAIVLIVIVLVVIMVIGGTGLGILSGYINTTQEIPNSLFAIREQTSHMYDRDGELIATMTGASNINRERISFSEVTNTYIDDAFIAIEDRSFHRNIGIDPRRIISAVISTVVNRGDSDHGGSTITQQTVKMITGDDQLSFQRKVQEWYRAVRLTDQLSKAEIMELYLNHVPMGNSYVGVQSAAKAYFGKPASELNLAESAILAGIPKSPSSYNLRTELGRKNAQRRQRIVLQAMLDEELITVREFEDALNYEIVYNQENRNSAANQVFSYFEEYVMNEVTRDLMEEYGYSYGVANTMVMNGGLEIHTTQNTEIQDRLDELFRDQERFQKNPSAFINMPESPQGASIIFDNATNTVAAMQGGYGEKDRNLVFNRATEGHKPVGSIIKPIAITAPAIELELITGATIIKDEEVFMDFQNPDRPWPLNYSRDYVGDMNVRDTIKISNNVPPTKILNEIGLDVSKNFMSLMGLDMTNQDLGLSITVGSFSLPPTPFEMGNAYLTFMNGGQYALAKGYSRVLDPNGTVILENSPDYMRVFSPESSYMMTKIMEDVLLYETGGLWHLGTGRRIGPIENAQGESIASAAKTGTADDHSDEWVVLQTPYYTGIGWYGFDNRIKATLIDNADRYNIQLLVGDLMHEIHQDLPAADWVQPAGIIALEICTISGQLATPGCGKYTRTEYFKANSPLTPTEPCGVHSRADTPKNRFQPDVDFMETGKGYGYGGVI